MNDEFDFFETEYQGGSDDPIKIAQKRVRKGAQPARSKKNKDSQKVTLLSLGLMLMGLVLIVSLLFQFSINSRYQELAKAMEDAEDLTGSDGTSLVSRVSEVENSITAINARLDQISGSISSGTPDEIPSDADTDEIDQETQDRTTQQIQQGTTATSASSTQTSQSTSGTKDYTVKEGDSPWVIANGDAAKMQKILELNGLTEETASNLYVGQVIKIPAN